MLFFRILPSQAIRDARKGRLDAVDDHIPKDAAKITVFAFSVCLAVEIYRIQPLPHAIGIRIVKTVALFPKRVDVIRSHISIAARILLVAVVFQKPGATC